MLQLLWERDGWAWKNYGRVMMLWCLEGVVARSPWSVNHLSHGWDVFFCVWWAICLLLLAFHPGSSVSWAMRFFLWLQLVCWYLLQQLPLESHPSGVSQWLLHCVTWPILSFQGCLLQLPGFVCCGFFLQSPLFLHSMVDIYKRNNVNPVLGGVRKGPG